MDVHQLPLFADLPGAVVDAALQQFREVEVDYGTRLIEEGETDPTLLCLVQGELVIRTGDTVLANAVPGDLVGEMALFGEGQRMASVEAATLSRLLLLDRAGYEALRQAQNPVARQLETYALEQLMQRLSDTSDAIAELSAGSPAKGIAPAKGFFSAVRGLFGSGGPRTAPTIDAAEVLRRTPFFVDAPDDALAEIAERMRPEAHDAGSFLCTEGVLGQEMYLLADGLVEVVITTDGERVEQLATLEPGDAFGMIALLDSRPRMASVVAKVQCSVLVLGLEDWQDLVNARTAGGSAMRVAMIRCVSDQLAFANAQLSQLDLTRRIEGVRPLLMARSGLEAHGAHLTPAVPPERRPR